MRFHSPWRWQPYVMSIAIVRRLLRLFHISEEGFIRKLVTSQNRRVLQYLHDHPPRSVLLIMPRCLKHKGCPVDVRGSLAACHTCDCGDCPLADVARLTASFGVRALVAFRSHIAFAMARREQPDLIIATACDDRLIKALRSVPEIPAVLAPLSSMERPCINAHLDLQWIENQLRLACGSPEQAPRAAFVTLPEAESQSLANEVRAGETESSQRWPIEPDVSRTPSQRRACESHDW